MCDIDNKPINKIVKLPSLSHSLSICRSKLLVLEHPTHTKNEWDYAKRKMGNCATTEILFKCKNIIYILDYHVNPWYNFTGLFVYTLYKNKQ